MEQISITYDYKKRPLPSCLINYEDFMELNPEEKNNFCSRMFYIEEISIDCKEYYKNIVNFITFVDNIELDLYVNIDTSKSIDNKQTSIWLIHTAWRYDISENPCADVLNSNVLGKFNSLANNPVDKYQFCDYMKELGLILTEALNDFYNSVELRQCLSNFIFIDLIILTMLQACVRFKIYYDFRND